MIVTAEQDRATRAFADKDPDSMVMLPDTEESMRFMMLRMCRDPELAQQIPCDVQVVDFDMCRSGHTDKGPVRKIAHPLEVARRVTRRCPSHQQHFTKNTDTTLRTAQAGQQRCARRSLRAQKSKSERIKTKAHCIFVVKRILHDEATGERLPKLDVKR